VIGLIMALQGSVLILDKEVSKIDESTGVIGI
jgi:hypothetical protein